MISDICQFKDIHKGSDIYVLGSGPSCNYIDPEFLEGKISVGTNQTYRKFDTDYIIRKEHSLIDETLGACDSKVVVAKRNAGNGASLDTHRASDNLFYYDHLVNTHILDLTCFDHPNHLAVSYSTITTSMHFAYHLGAKNIILMGVDHGVLDDKFVFDGYYKSIKETCWNNWDDYRNWLKGLEGDTVKMKGKLKSLNINVYSINPFINFRLEGHKYAY